MPLNAGVNPALLGAIRNHMRAYIDKPNEKVLIDFNNGEQQTLFVEVSAAAWGTAHVWDGAFVHDGRAFCACVQCVCGLQH